MDYVIKDTDLTAIANAIRSKNGSSDTYTVAEMPDQIMNIEKGASTEDPGLVQFFNPYGELKYSYTADEFLALSAMPSDPALPTGLVSQGWNWSLQDAQDYVEEYRHLNVGQMCTTNDGKTRIHIRAINNQDTIIRFAQSVANGVIVNWGDGSATETYSETAQTNHTHKYATVGNYTITLEVTDGTLTFSGTASASGYGIYGARSSSTTQTSNSQSRANEIIGVNIGANVTIGAYVFYNCQSLTEITIPSGVTSIGTYTFYGCHSLTAITLPTGMTGIGTNSFENCFSLTEASMPLDLETIGATAFGQCYSLTKITIPSGVTTIYDYTFQACYSMAEVVIPSGVTSIGARSFNNCISLHELTIPSKVQSIGDYAFSGCHSLTGLTLPSSVESLGTYVFRMCYSLTELTIPSGVTSIGDYAFDNCYSLTKVDIPSSITRIGNYAFSNCHALTEITIPSGVTSIGNYTFYSCSSLAELNIPSSVTSIGIYAFCGCYSLTELTIPSGVTSIGNYALQYCSSLTELTIPSGVTTIGNYVFQYCNAVKEFHFLRTSPPTLSGINAFSTYSTTSDVTFYVPYSADHSILTAYKEATNWSTFADRMEEEPQS